MKRSGILLVIVVVLFSSSNGIFAQNKLTGLVNYNGDNTQSIPQVAMGLYDLQDNLVFSATTNDKGRYLFGDVPSGEYYLRASSTYDPEMVSIQDSYLVLKYLLGKIELTPVQFEAADIDNSGTVTWYDYNFITVDYLVDGEPFPAGTWQFEEAYIDFTSREVPPDTSDLWGITEGDVDGEWMPSGRGLYIPEYTYYELNANKGQEIQLEVTSNFKEEIGGFSLNLAYPASVLDILDVAGPDNNLNYTVDAETGVIRVVWLDEMNTGGIDGDKLITVTVNTKTEDFNGSTFELLPGSMVLDANGEKAGEIEIQLPKLEKNLLTEISVTVYPNPVVDALHVSINLEEAGLARVSVYDVSGKLMTGTQNRMLEKGQQLITVDTQTYTPGYYFYVVELSGNTSYRMTGQIVKSQ